MYIKCIILDCTLIHVMGPSAPYEIEATESNSVYSAISIHTSYNIVTVLHLDDLYGQCVYNGYLVSSLINGFHSIGLVTIWKFEF